MMKSSNVISVLRRDALFVWNAVVAVMFVGFASLAIGAALVDFVPRH